ncbi:MAG TPA: DNA-formamidopyrimidine glycosylase family protein [Gaiellaceae bacterium]|jgi:endonuclease-8|nr:DNA-formamidopyrimidine glycosylase family protein [Gaiellaceae bacterium]
MPEGDSLRRAAARLQPLVGERVEVETPHPRAAAKQIAQRLDGRRLEAVEAVGKNLLLRFEGGLVLRSHLRMTGRWRLDQRGAKRIGRPWLVLRGDRHEGVLWNGPVLELSGDVVRGLGPDILDLPPDLDAIVANLRRTDQHLELGDALVDQRLVSGIGNLWKAEALWEVRLSPWSTLGALSDHDLRAAVEAAARLMQASVAGTRSGRRVYRRHVCPRCGGRIASRGQEDANRTTYWCPACQAGKETSGA